MKPVTWPSPTADGGETTEYALTFDQGRQHRVLVIPALFNESNKLRRLTVEVMRRLDGAGIDAFLPDLPGTNESLAPLAMQTLEGWTGAMLAAANHFRANRVLAMRGGGLIVPKVIPGWHYAPVKGASQLRHMLRARTLASRELGREESQDSLMAQGVASGLDLIGYQFGSEMLRQLQERVPDKRTGITVIEQDLIGGGGLWLRAEPGEDREQADALAAVITMGLTA